MIVQSEIDGLVVGVKPDPAFEYHWYVKEAEPAVPATLIALGVDPLQIVCVYKSRLDELFLGFGVPVTKSALLSSVSVRPPFFLKIALAALGAGAFDVSLQETEVVPNPTLYTTFDVGQPFENAVVIFAKATLPCVALRFNVDLVISAVMVGTVPSEAPPDKCIK